MLETGALPSVWRLTCSYSKISRAKAWVIMASMMPSAFFECTKSVCLVKERTSLLQSCVILPSNCCLHSFCNPLRPFQGILFADHLIKHCLCHLHPHALHCLTISAALSAKTLLRVKSSLPIQQARLYCTSSCCSQHIQTSRENEVHTKH